MHTTYIMKCCTTSPTTNRSMLRRGTSKLAFGFVFGECVKKSKD